MSAPLVEVRSNANMTPTNDGRNGWRRSLGDSDVACSNHVRRPSATRGRGSCTTVADCAGGDHGAELAAVIVAGCGYNFRTSRSRQQARGSGGGGIPGGIVVGSTTSRGETPLDRAVRPGDYLATVYRALGIDLGTTFHDEQGRPRPILAEGRPIVELCG